MNGYKAVAPGTDTEAVSTRCPAALLARLEVVKGHAARELREATRAVEARRQHELAQIQAREAKGLARAEVQQLYAASYARQQEGDAQARAAWGLPDEAQARKKAEAAARTAVAAVWQTYVAAQEARFGL